ncbi:hypothetical protein AGLY_000408 [Aphis glycines]|uniref:Uncharacterized protein n=1 Tax=Aphis glycines TaxID=307491 RepID=A0A6G0U6W0_APHGL|nr:hypothetical protein AGLY_000408 [Aphis glycines]
MFNQIQNSNVKSKVSIKMKESFVLNRKIVYTNNVKEIINLTEDHVFYIVKSIIALTISLLFFSRASIALRWLTIGLDAPSLSNTLGIISADLNFSAAATCACWLKSSILASPNTICWVFEDIRIVNDKQNIFGLANGHSIDSMDLKPIQISNNQTIFIHTCLRPSLDMIFLAFFSPRDCLALLDKSSAVTPLAPSPPLPAATSTPLESLSLSAASFLGSSKLTFFVASISVNSGMFPVRKTCCDQQKKTREDRIRYYRNHNSVFTIASQGVCMSKLFVKEIVHAELKFYYCTFVRLKSFCLRYQQHDDVPLQARQLPQNIGTVTTFDHIS